MYIDIHRHMYIAIICDHEIRHTSYTICQTNFMAPFLWMECNCLKARQSHYEEAGYFLPEIPGTH